MNPTSSEENKKTQLVVTVSSSKTCWLGGFIHRPLVISRHFFFLTVNRFPADQLLSTENQTVFQQLGIKQIDKV